MAPSTPCFFVLGAGGLGCPALSGLACLDRPAPIVIVDADRVETSNLQRQVLYTVADVGAPKAEAARFRLRSRRPELRIESISERVNADTLDRRLAELPRGSVVLECTDDPGLKFAANDLCLRRGIDLVVAGVVGWRGHALAVRRGAACLRCFFEDPPPPALAPACERVGVIGSAAGVLGQLMALLAARLIAGEDAAGELIVADMLSTSVRTSRPFPREDCLACTGRAPIDHPARVCAPAS